METAWYLFHGITALLLTIGVGFTLLNTLKLSQSADMPNVFTDPSLTELLKAVNRRLETLETKSCAPVIITDRESVDAIAENLAQLTASVAEMGQKRLEVTQVIQTPDGLDMTEIQLLLMDLKEQLPALGHRFEEFERFILQIRGR